LPPMLEWLPAGSNRIYSHLFHRSRPLSNCMMNQTTQMGKVNSLVPLLQLRPLPCGPPWIRARSFPDHQIPRSPFQQDEQYSARHTPQCQSLPDHFPSLQTTHMWIPIIIAADRKPFLPQRELETCVDDRCYWTIGPTFLAFRRSSSPTI
jgi:hypothetical protein